MADDDDAPRMAMQWSPDTPEKEAAERPQSESMARRAIKAMGFGSSKKKDGAADGGSTEGRG
eukprot:CAMPEP_0172617272 /NCGR_PEP_ID=MMETSP1068-20121228/70155_1 /TAXON_ID=35684 /ORGANISM="Pseudopedinella elastica, Strain CCMP716" /LENGTH=61 /DNA_ID=CAMNT_0013423001 /DNA_START=142 /DNA_END=323 /DNA_ORIENTATION=-